MFCLAASGLHLCSCSFETHLVIKPGWGGVIDWGAVEVVQRAPVRNSFASCQLRQSRENVHITAQLWVQAAFQRLLSDSGFHVCTRIHGFLLRGSPLQLQVCVC